MPTSSLRLTLVTFAMSLAVALTASAQTLNVLHNFGVASGDGNIPYSSVITDNAGNLYGTSLEGGTYNRGAVYELSPVSGGWKETVLYSFTGGADGGSPHAPLLSDSAGNVYSTTIKGGLNAKNCVNSAPGSGCGVVFELSPNSSGGWTETVLYSFAGGKDGANPYAGLIRDNAGNFYGTTTGGGSGNHGTVFKLAPSGTSWQETILHNFAGTADGNAPYAPVVFDHHGDLLGTTYQGGSAGLGIVYALRPNPSGSWAEKILHTFEGAGDGAQPFAGVVLDAAGNIYGATTAGGSFNYGAVFELSAANKYASTLLHSFNLDGTDGTFPNGVIFDGKGNLIGSTQGAGKNDGNGTLFKLTPGSSGWTETVLFTFQGSVDGTYPNDTPAIDAAGRIYGTTIWGGTLGPTNGGVTYQFIP